MEDLLQTKKNIADYDHDDLILWKEFTAGQRHSYEAIYNRYVNELYRYCYLILTDKSHAEDVIHDVFTDLWSNRKNLGEIRSVRLYLFTSIKRRSFRKLKKERKFKFFDASGKEDSMFEIVPSFLDEIIKIDDKGRIVKKFKKYIAALSKRQREIIYLRFYQDMTYPEIATLLQLDQKYTYNLASKAFCALRKIIPQNKILSLLVCLFYYFY